MPKPQPKQIDPSEIEDFALSLVSKVKFPMLSTIDDNKPRVRPISPIHTEGFKVYFANLKSYKKTKQIEVNPNVELCYMDSEHNQVRIEGLASIVTDRNLIQEFWDNNRLLEHYLGNIDNPELIVYCVKPQRVTFMQEWALKYWEIPIK